MRILIADDHSLFRDGLRSLLAGQGHETVGEAKNGREAIELARRIKPDMVLMDVSMPELDGITATRLLVGEMPDIKVVILTASEDDANLFDATIQITVASCNVDLTFTGVGAYTSATKQLTMIAATAARDRHLIFIGVKP